MMCDVAIQILPSGEIMVERSPDKGVNDSLISLLAGVVGSPGEMREFLSAAEHCEQIFGDEALCG
jgi:hypothetical protein